MSGFVFYDENHNGRPDAAETVRLPGVTIEIGGRTAQSSAGGRFVAADVPSGVQSISARSETLPAYFQAGAAVSVAVPVSGDVAVPAELELGAGMRANTYMAFGDSITVGDGSSDGGYRNVLQAHLQAYWGKGEVLDEGLRGSKSDVGRGRIGASLSTRKPAYVLILYGTNDWNVAECRSNPPCETIENLRWMVRNTRNAWNVHPILGTIPPVNPLWVDKGANARNDWVRQMNVFLREMAVEERVPVADIYGAFSSQPSLPQLFDDDKHPNDAGYRLIARSFFDAIRGPHAFAASTRSASPLEGAAALHAKDQASCETSPSPRCDLASESQWGSLYRGLAAEIRDLLGHASLTAGVRPSVR